MVPDIQEVHAAIFDQSPNAVADIINNWPRVLYAIGILLAGWAIAWFIQWFIVKVSSKIALHKVSEKTGFTSFLKKAQIKRPPSVVIANFLSGYVLFFAFLGSANILGLTFVSEFLHKLIYDYIPQVIVALFIVIIGVQIANTVSSFVESTLNLLDVGAVRILALVAKSLIILFSFLAALLQLNIAEDLVKILFTGVVGMICLAGGLAMGLGSKDFVREILSDLKNHNK